jgi:hypothetical protein
MSTFCLTLLPVFLSIFKLGTIYRNSRIVLSSFPSFSRHPASFCQTQDSVWLSCLTLPTSPLSPTVLPIFLLALPSLCHHPANIHAPAEVLTVFLPTSRHCLDRSAYRPADIRALSNRPAIFLRTSKVCLTGLRTFGSV